MILSVSLIVVGIVFVLGAVVLKAKASYYLSHEGVFKFSFQDVMANRSWAKTAYRLLPATTSLGIICIAIGFGLMLVLYLAR